MNRFKVQLGIGICLIPIFLFSQINAGTGKLFRWDLYKNYTGSDSTASQRILYDYPLPEQRIETSYQFEEGLWIAQTRINYILDARGRTIENILERYEPVSQQFIPQARTQTFPRGTSLTLVDSVFTFNWAADQSTWERFIVQRNRFNTQNQLIESESVISFSGQNFVNRDLHFYDAQGNLIRIENYSRVNGQFILTSFSTHTYENGLLSRVTSFAPVPPKDSVPLNLSVTTYNENNLIRSIESFNWDIVNKVWNKTSSTILTYNVKNLLQSRTTEVVANGNRQISRNDLFYNNRDLLIQEQNFVGAGTPPEWTLDSKKFYYYDLASSLKEPSIQLIQISPNPSRDEIRLDLPSGAYFQIYNAAGQVQLSGEMNGQNRLDVRHWPKGMYWIVAQDGQQRWVGKMVKE